VSDPRQLAEESLAFDSECNMGDGGGECSDCLLRKQLSRELLSALDDARVFRDFVELVANSPDENLNETNWRALRADARNRLDTAQGGRLAPPSIRCLVEGRDE